MTGQGRPRQFTTRHKLAVSLLLTASCLPPTAHAAEPTPIQDDARLNDVHFVGTRTGWAVGDRGVIWHTTDGGQTWSLKESPVNCVLTSVCFLTDRIGWAAGHGTTPYAQIPYGVVLSTQDGGATWEQLAGPKSVKTRIPKFEIRNSSRQHLPPLTFIKFFGPDEGVAVGESSVEFPTGVLFTEDGGRTWQGMPGNRESGWRAADFLNHKTGVAAGLRGRISLVGNARLLPPRIDELGLRGLWDLTLQPDGSGWLAGDGGLVLHTTNGGVVWQPPPTFLPADVREVSDFLAVAQQGNKVWLAGSPGSVIWHSPDAGRTWLRRTTGQTVPIHALHFANDSLGFAAGALGSLLRTEDGGQTWQAIRGGQRRAALMTITTRAGGVSFPLLAKLSAEEGYRSVALLPVRRDVDSQSAGLRDLDLRLPEAVAAAGGSAARIDWRFPVDIPGLERDRERLIDAWNRHTEGRLREVFPGKLVAWLRTWRPSVVVLDTAAPDDAATALLNDAVLHAVRQAADATSFIHHYELAGLKPWAVEKVYQRLPAGSTGDTMIDLHELLPRSAKTVQSIAAPAAGRLEPLSPNTARREAYRLLYDRTQTSGAKTANRNFFTSVPISPGSAARRELPIFDEDEYERQQKLAERRKHLQAIAEQTVDSDRQGMELIAHLKPMTRGLDSEQAAVQLMQLAEDYRRRALWELMEATLIELVNEYPDEPAAWEGMRRLLQLWTGTETAFQRARRIRVMKSTAEHDAQRLLKRIQASTRTVRGGPAEPIPTEQEQPADPIDYVLSEGSLEGKDSDWRTGTVKNWHNQALQLAKLIRDRNPALYESPQVQFPLASLLRQRGAHTLADRFYRRFQGGGLDDPWRITAMTEIWLAGRRNLPPKKVAACRSTRVRPKLDGVFGDECWQHANVVWLTEMPAKPASPVTETEESVPGEPSAAIIDNQQNRALAMFAYDSEYFYFALSVPRDPQAPDAMPVHAGRTHDSDLLDYDRLRLFLDVDRDYATYYALSVDQRGWTADSCWTDASWNPRWHVFADAGNSRWRIEAAVPWKELVPQAPVPGDVWAMGLVRTVPAVRLESWTHPATEEPAPEHFGLLRFQ